MSRVLAESEGGRPLGAEVLDEAAEAWLLLWRASGSGRARVRQAWLVRVQLTDCAGLQAAPRSVMAGTGEQERGKAVASTEKSKVGLVGLSRIL